MSVASRESGSAGLMDAMYRHQRHIYDASRKFYLLGRDRLIDELAPPPAATVLEIGCGTGRNLVAIARAYPGRMCFGLDVSAEMLATARQSIGRARLSDRIILRQGDATAFDPAELFGQAGFDRIVISYALSMIPPWRSVVEEALCRLAPGGELHIVDFGDQHALPAPFRAVLNRWLGLFHVTPRRDLAVVLDEVAQAAGAHVRIQALHRGYAALAVLRKPA